jgi:hypothetical protein
MFFFLRKNYFNFLKSRKKFQIQGKIIFLRWCLMVKCNPEKLEKINHSFDYQFLVDVINKKFYLKCNKLLSRIWCKKLVFLSTSEIDCGKLYHNRFNVINLITFQCNPHLTHIVKCTYGLQLLILENCK